MAASRNAPSLAQLIRRSPALDGAARRRWLAVLPHLTAEDRERLRDILTQTGPSEMLEPLQPPNSSRLLEAEGREEH